MTFGAGLRCPKVAGFRGENSCLYCTAAVCQGTRGKCKRYPRNRKYITAVWCMGTKTIIAYRSWYLYLANNEWCGTRLWSICKPGGRMCFPAAARSEAEQLILVNDDERWHQRCRVTMKTEWMLFIFFLVSTLKLEDPQSLSSLGPSRQRWVHLFLCQMPFLQSSFKTMFLQVCAVLFCLSSLFFLKPPTMSVFFQTLSAHSQQDHIRGKMKPHTRDHGRVIIQSQGSFMLCPTERNVV